MTDDGDGRTEDSVEASATEKEWTDAEVAQAKKDYYLGIFLELMKSKRFADFVDSNFTIQNRVNEENKTHETLVIENPESVGPALSPNTPPGN